MQIKLSCEDVNVYPDTGKTVFLEANIFRVDDLYDQLNLTELIEHLIFRHGHEKILEYIDKEVAKDFYDLKENDE